MRPFLTALHSTPDLVCKVHTKNGPFRYASAWRHIMFETLLHPKAIKNVRAAFEWHPRLMLVGPSVLYKSARGSMFSNEHRTARLSQELFGREPPADWGFFPARCFGHDDQLWNLRSVESFPFEPEPIGEDGFMPHAFERLFRTASCLSQCRGWPCGLRHQGSPNTASIGAILRRNTQ